MDKYLKVMPNGENSHISDMTADISMIIRPNAL